MKRSDIISTLQSATWSSSVDGKKLHLLLGIFQLLHAIADHLGIIEDDIEEEETES